MQSSQCIVETLSSRPMENNRDRQREPESRQKEVLVESHSDKVSQLCSQLSGMDRGQSERLLNLEEENLILKKQLNECMLEIQALQDVLKNTW